MSTWRTRRAGGVVAAGVAAACLLALAACGGPPGVDGDLTNNWPAFPEPKVPVPVVGQCLAVGSNAGSVPVELTAITAVGCSTPHELEVVYVGQYSPAASAGGTAPARDSAESRTAYAECDRAARDYVGGDWHAGLLSLHFAPPTTAKWEAGARFFFCSLMELESMRKVRDRIGSVKEGLSGGQPLAKRCFYQVGTEDADGFFPKVDDVRPVACDEPHTAEYAGNFSPPDGPPPTEATVTKLQLDGCEPVIADFFGLSIAGLHDRGDVRYLAVGPNRNSWPLGDRTIACFVTVSTKHQVHSSLKLLGGRPLPR